MDLIYWAALASFMAGVCGYIITRFWIIPIGRYRRLKQRLLTSLDRYAQKLPADDAATLKHAAGKRVLRDIRQAGMQLIDLTNGELPYWYRLVLLTRQESAQQASDHMLRLGNMPTSGAARHCIHEIRRQLEAKKDRGAETNGKLITESYYGKENNRR